jgi:geranylgeranyl pyrophosphate synthase
MNYVNVRKEDQAKNKQGELNTATYYKDRIYDILIRCIKETSFGENEYYSLLSNYSNRRGNYSRSLLLTIAAIKLGAREDYTLRAAAAVQLSEDWILALDDMQDGAELRRGKSSLHVEYGRDLAELAVVMLAL